MRPLAVLLSAVGATAIYSGTNDAEALVPTATLAVNRLPVPSPIAESSLSSWSRSEDPIPSPIAEVSSSLWNRSGDPTNWEPSSGSPGSFSEPSDQWRRVTRPLEVLHTVTSETQTPHAGRASQAMERSFEVLKSETLPSAGAAPLSPEYPSLSDFSSSHDAAHSVRTMGTSSLPDNRSSPGESTVAAAAAESHDGPISEASSGASDVDPILVDPIVDQWQAVHLPLQAQFPNPDAWRAQTREALQAHFPSPDAWRAQTREAKSFQDVPGPMHYRGSPIGKH